MHFFICKRFAQKSPSRTPRRTGQACPLSRASLLQAGFARRKKESAAADGVGARSRQAAKSSGSQTEWTTNSLRLPTAGRSLREEKRIARKAAKPPRVRRGGGQELQ